VSNATLNLKPPLHVLVVDHDDLVRDQTVRRLIEDGYDVSVAKSASGLSQRVARLGPDIVLVDVLMPGLRGDELSRLLGSGRTGDGPAVVVHTKILRGYLRQAVDMQGVLGVIRVGQDEQAFLHAFRALAERLGDPDAERPGTPKAEPILTPKTSGTHRIDVGPVSMPFARTGRGA
jgi:CheY-like chemotaxis protein